MRATFFSIIALVSIFLNSCNVTDPPKKEEQNGSIIFWLKANYNLGTIDVYIDNSFVGTITSYYSNGNPQCGSQGCVTKSLTTGQHSFSAVSQSGAHWNNNFEVSSGTCKPYELTYTGTGNGGNCDWKSAVNCVQITKSTGTRCGDPQSVEIICKNVCNQNLKIYICIQRSDGTWNGLPDGTFETGVAPGKTSSNYVCKGTGQYEIFAMPITAFNSNKCGYPSCN